MIKQITMVLALFHLFGLLSLPAMAEDRPNIVWIFVEDMNGWYGCYGDDTVPTPNIDAIAHRGVRFDRTYMPAGVCSATRSAIATGAMQTSLGIHNHRSSRQRVPEEVIHGTSKRSIQSTTRCATKQSKRALPTRVTKNPRPFI